MADVRTLPPGYPVAWEADVVLRDGSVAHVRPIKPSDADGIREFHAGQSDESTSNGSKSVWAADHSWSADSATMSSVVD